MPCPEVHSFVDGPDGRSGGEEDWRHKSRFTEEQIIGMLKEAERTGKTGEIVRPHGIAKETFCRWRRRYGRLEVRDAQRLRALEDENCRLKRIVADQALNVQVLEDVLGKES